MRCVLASIDRCHRCCAAYDPSTSLAAVATSLNQLPDDLSAAEPLNLLDGARVQGSWCVPLSVSLEHLIRRCDEVDLAAMQELANFACRHRSYLQRLSSRSGSVPRTFSIQKKHPVVATLFALARTGYSSPGLDLLGCVLVNAALELGQGDKRVAKLGEMIRGATEDADSPLRLIIADSSNVPDLISKVELHLETSVTGLHGGFEQLWKSSLRDMLYRWLRADPARMRHALAPSGFAPHIDAPELDLLPDQADGDCDDSPSLECVLTEPQDSSGWAASARVEWQRAKARVLGRQSEGNVFSPPDFLVPCEVIKQVAIAAIAAAARLQASGQSADSERYVALALSMATGIRELDLMNVVWGEDGEVALAIHPALPVLRKRVMRPLGAAQPPEAMNPLLEKSVDWFEWPLPPSLHHLLQGLAVEREPQSGTLVLPQASAGAVSYRLRGVIAELAPGLALGAGTFRIHMAAYFAVRLGVDVAQLLLSDSLSMSTAPAHYCGCQVSMAVKTIAELQTQWFGKVEPTPGQGNDGFLGSRLVLTHDAACLWSKQLRHQRRSTAHRKNANDLEGWVPHRNFLAGALCAVSGHRPLDALGRIDLDSVIPEYGLIVIQDKLIDPLRKHRIVCTGRRWLVELRAFLDRLVAIRDKFPESTAGRLAEAILRSEVPLFSAMDSDGRVTAFDAASLRQTMPSQLVEKPNHYRHRLNQYLQQEKVDPELRHAQMGWVLGPTHATADLSPLSARDIANKLGPVLDDFLLHDGWFASSQRLLQWTWKDVPSRPLVDWSLIARQHVADHVLAAKTIRQERIERGREVEIELLPRLARAILEFQPNLRLDVGARRLLRAEGTNPRSIIEISEDDCGVLLNRVRQGDATPGSGLETAIATILLNRLLKRSHHEGLTQGAIPRRPVLSVTAEPSPFLSGMGLAVRHAEEFRQSVLDGVQRWQPHDRGVLSVLSVMCFSAYRDLTVAKAAVAAASKFKRAAEPGDWLRIPAAINGKPVQVVLSGIPALVLNNRVNDAPTGRPPDDKKIGNWVRRSLPAARDFDNEQALELVVQTLVAAGRVELSGPERMLSLGQVSLSTVSVARCLGQDDRWPVRTCASSNNTLDEMSRQVHESADDDGAKSPSKEAAIAHYRKLTSLLNIDQLNKIGGKKSDSHHGWRGRLKKELGELLRITGASTNAGLMAGFAAHRLQYGGAREKNLAHRTLSRELTRFGRDLLEVLGDRALVSLTGEELSEAYAAVLYGKPTTARPNAMEALRMFQRYLELAHRVEFMPFGDLELLAGPRAVQTDAGLLTDAEIETALGVLHEDIQSSDDSSDLAPEATRLAALRFLMGLLLDASGARPGSVYGLLLSDIHLLGEGRDFIHIHASGGYGEAKSIASVGFIPLQGARWSRYRTWVNDWLSRERSAQSAPLSGSTPLFGSERGKRRRFDRRFLTDRLAEILRWSSDQPDARPYWLRKSRIMSRHRANNESKKSARATRAVLCASGHATMATPILHYISDPAVVLNHSLQEGRMAPRADLLRVSRVEKPHLIDMKWQRAGGPQGKRRLAVLLDDLGVPAAQVPEELLTEPPQLHRQKTLLPIHIDRFARAFQKFGSEADALLQSGLSSLQTERLQRAAILLVGQRGKVPWRVPGLKHLRSIMSPPRRLKGADQVLDLLEKLPSTPLCLMADAWAARGHADRLVDAASQYLLLSDEEVEAARGVLASMGLEAVITQNKDSLYILDIPVRNERRQSNYRQRETTKAALDWLLAMVWLHQQLTHAS